MAKSVSATMVIVLMAFMLARIADSSRAKTRLTRQPEMTKCMAEGSNGAEGMQITWGSKKPMLECGPTRHNKGGYTYEYQFTNVFASSFGTKCECSIEGKAIVSFKHRNTNEARLCKREIKKECAEAYKENPSEVASKTECWEEETPWAIKTECWEAYKRARGTRFRSAGEISVPEYSVPWLNGNFVVSRGEKCQAEACNSIVLPGVLDDMSRDHKRIIGAAIKKIMDGKKDDVPGSLVKLIEVLPSDALDDAEFQQIDTDGDGTLDLEELSQFYTEFEPAVLEQFIKDVDANGNGKIDPAEFKDLKKKMRDYDPLTDLIDGEVELLRTDSGTLKELKPKWKTTAVACMIGDQPADPKECEGNQGLNAEQAIQHFNEGC